MMMNLHTAVEDHIERDHDTIEHAIERAAYEQAHPGHDLDTDQAAHDGPFEGDDLPLCERTVRGGPCTMCGTDSAELLPWSRQRICWDCMDIQLDMLALAVKDGQPGYLMETTA